MTEQDVRDHLLRRYGAWMSAIVRKDIDAIAAIYANDAVYLPPGRPRLEGRDVVVAMWRTYFARPDFRAIYTPSLTISKNLELAYDVGAYVVTLTRDNSPLEIRGKYVVISKLEGSDSVVAVDIDNSDST